ncbi:MAG TPA: DinB family protein [Pyrinomonadaceae bacterium]
MDKWRHLLIDGEFAERKRILEGLTLDQATRRPSAHSHTIYEELWHATRWQKIIVMRDEQLYAEWARGQTFPAGPPATEEEWTALVDEFLDGLERALDWTAPEKVKLEIDPGVTMGDALHSLAVHNSYHLGKIVALRQAIGAWPLEAQS